MGGRISVFSVLTAGVVFAGLTCAAGATESNPNVPAQVVPLAAPGPAAAQATKHRRLLRFVNPAASVECKVKSPAYEGRAPLRAVRRAIQENRPVRVVALGSSSTVGVGASSPRATYPIRLENDLEGVIEGLKVEMFARGQSGEVAEGAAERLKIEVPLVDRHLFDDRTDVFENRFDLLARESRLAEV